MNTCLVVLQTGRVFERSLTAFYQALEYEARVTLLVGVKVLFQIAATDKCLDAVRTLEWLVIVMNSHVSSEVALLCKQLRTHRAWKLFPSVNQHVTVERSRRNKSLVANLTHERSFVRYMVDPEMYVQFILVLKEGTTFFFFTFK